MDNKPYEGPHVLNNLPKFHEKLLEYGERPIGHQMGKGLLSLIKIMEMCVKLTWKLEKYVI